MDRTASGSATTWGRQDGAPHQPPRRPSCRGGRTPRIPPLQRPAAAPDREGGEEGWRPPGMQ
eukprot:13387307-Alexandrium_andersonii.AAC.1